MALLLWYNVSLPHSSKTCRHRCWLYHDPYQVLQPHSPDVLHPLSMVLHPPIPGTSPPSPTYSHPKWSYWCTTLSHFYTVPRPAAIAAGEPSSISGTRDGGMRWWDVNGEMVGCEWRDGGMWMERDDGMQMREMVVCEWRDGRIMSHYHTVPRPAAIAIAAGDTTILIRYSNPPRPGPSPPPPPSLCKCNSICY